MVEQNEQETEDILRRFQPDGTITYVNDAACRFYQRTCQEMVGYNLAAFLSPAEKEEIIAAIFSISPEKPTVITRPNFIRTDGVVRCVEYENRGVFAPDGTVLEYCSVGREVGEVRPRNKGNSDNAGLGPEKKGPRYLEEKRVGIFSAAMLEVIEHAEKYHQDRSIPVLIEGETGVGKEVVARLIHFGGRDSLLPFVDINCTALSPSLFESELFGYEAGAFTGAVQRGQRGKLDSARGGSLFLDEIAEIPMDLQAKLLRVLEEKNFYRVGGLHKVTTDIRVIAATNIGFSQSMREGKFRKDLYYRLKVGHIRIPSLRERPDDILPLAQMLVTDFSAKRKKNFKGLSDECKELFIRHPWPGNIRELKNLIDWATFMYDDTLLRSEHVAHRLETFDEATVSHAAASIQQASLISVADIHAALVNCAGNKTQAAKSLGISIRTLYNRLQKDG